MDSKHPIVRPWLAACAMAVGFASLFLPGCTGFSTSLIIQNATLDNPSLPVGGSTHLTIQASAPLGRTLHYRVIADRGRVIPDTATTQSVLTYYAPYSSKTPNSGGNLVTGDRLQIQVDDGYSTQKQVIPVNLGGNTITTVQNPDANGYGTIMLASTDDNGFQVTNQRSLKDVQGLDIKGAEPTVSPDGRLIAYVDYSPSSPTTAIRTIDASGRIQTIVSAGDTLFNLDPSWAPNSLQLAFVSNRSGNYDVYRVATTGEGNIPIRVTNTAVNERFPAWNPSLQSDRVSTMVVSAQMNDMSQVNNTGNTAAWNLFMMNIQSGQYIKQLTNLSDIRDYAFEPQWRADGQVIAYTANGPVQDQFSTSQRFQRVYIQDVTQNAGSGVLLNRTETSTSVYESSPAWSQAGNVVAYLKAFSPASGTAAAQVWRHAVNGVVPSTDTPAQWTDFSSPLPALWINQTESRDGPRTAWSFGWN